MKRIPFILVLSCSLFLAPLHASAANLTFWTTENSDDRIQVIEFLVRAFMVMQDDVSVEVVSVNENELVERLQEAEKTGDMPHLVGTGSDLLVALCQMGLCDTETATRIVRSIGVERFYPGVLKLLSTPGGNSWYGVPFHGWVQGVWYRADWFKLAGLAPPDNWDSMMAAAKHFSDPSTGRYGIVVGTTDDHYAAQVFTQIARSNGAAMFYADGSLAFNSPQMVESLEFYASLAKYGPDGPQTWRARDFFMQGKLAMLFYSTFIMDDLALKRVAQDSLTDDNFEELSGAEFDPDLVRNASMAPMLVNKKAATYGMINGFGIQKDLSIQEQQAVESFLAFLYQPAQYVTWLHMAPGGMLPVLKDIAQSNTFLGDPSGIFRRYGREKVRETIDGLSSIDGFSMVDGRPQAAASVVYAEGVIPRMNRRTVFEGVSAKESVSRAAVEIESIRQSMEIR